VPRLLRWLLRGLCAFLLCWVAWLATPKPSAPRPAMNNRVRVLQYFCVSHGCPLWIGRELTDDEFRAISVAHALQHNNRPITPADLFGDQENNE
jgi:hypothetical protein